MIQFDNGPPDGDYVRYIDGLNAQREPAPSMNGDGFRVVPPGALPPVDLMTETGPQPGRVASTKRLLPAQATAVASALMTRDPQLARPSRASPAFGVDTRSTEVRVWLELAGVVAGVVLAAIGFFVQAAGPLLLIVGIGIIVSMVQRILRRRGLLAAPKVPGPPSR